MENIDVKDAKITIKVKAKTGYSCNMSAEISARQWGDINKVINSQLSSFVMKDKDGNPILMGQKFQFTYISKDKDEKLIVMVGQFRLDTAELRYEIEIGDNLPYSCLWYDSARMSEFKLL